MNWMSSVLAEAPTTLKWSDQLGSAANSINGLLGACPSCAAYDGSGFSRESERAESEWKRKWRSAWNQSCADGFRLIQPNSSERASAGLFGSATGSTWFARTQLIGLALCSLEHRVVVLYDSTFRERLAIIIKEPLL